MEQRNDDWESFRDKENRRIRRNIEEWVFEREFNEMPWEG